MGDISISMLIMLLLLRERAVGASQYQHIQLLDTKPFGKALVIDGKLQSAEIDEFNTMRLNWKRREEVYDVIIGDLADPIEGGPCYQLYTKSFYEFVVKPSLNQGGIFVTQAGPAGIFSHTEVFSCIYNTLRQASDSPFTLTADELDLRIKHRIKGENRYLDGKTFTSSSTLSKAVRKSLDNETHVYTEGNARFIYGHGSAYKQQQQQH
ncbi:UNVERIFIED_CONTAM: Thermospermine synthase ACAULIS5 [Sesamum calycinum]|uniref:Thermospermine synthase ACAULIS5 n=1 Tax=Sesamum calycinum TaxID=2727403 RepID=A0AAW2R8X6_9LAMI